MKRTISIASLSLAMALQSPLADGANKIRQKLTDVVWTSSFQARAIRDNITRILATGSARSRLLIREESLNTNECAVIIEYMHSPNPFIRRSSVIAAGAALSQRASTMVMPHVIHLLSDPVYNVRYYAADTIGQIGDTNSIALLEPLLNQSNMVTIAQRSIKKLKSRAPAISLEK